MKSKSAANFLRIFTVKSIKLTLHLWCKVSNKKCVCANRELDNGIQALQIGDSVAVLKLLDSFIKY